MEDRLTVGSADLPEKDQTLVHALIRVLDGGMAVPLRYSEKLGECNVVFASSQWRHAAPNDCVLVRVDSTARSDTPPARELSIAPPMRMSNVLQVLESAAQLLLGKQEAESPEQALESQLALFACIAKGLKTSEQRRSVIPLGAGQQMVVDFTAQRVHTSVPVETLLSGLYRVGEPHRVSPVEEEIVRSAPSHALRPLVWQLAVQLAQGSKSVPPRHGLYRLQRWPEAMALAIPGHPLLSALFSHRPLTLAQACAEAHMPAPRVHWFLEACLTLGLAVEVAPNPAPAPMPAASLHAPAAKPSWLNQLRERLKLW
jgi:hypothetical protein